MSNPFIIPGSPFTEVQRKQRERFRIGVYAALTTTAVFCFAMLIQGCRREVPQNKTTQADATTPSAVETTTAASPAAQPVDPAAQAPAPATSTADVVAAQTLAAAPANQGGVTSPVPVPATAPVADQPVTSPVVQPEPAKVEAAPAASTESTYVVKPGDTLIRIARTHSTTVQALKAANGLRTDRIVAGKQLKIPAARKLSSGSVQG